MKIRITNENYEKVEEYARQLTALGFNPRIKNYPEYECSYLIWWGKIKWNLLECAKKKKMILALN